MLHLVTCALALAAPALPAQDTVRAAIELEIGELSGPAPHEFGFVSGIALDAGGRLYVSDRLEKTVLVFSREGRLIARIGREGEGPGEFQAPTGPVIGESGALIVRDMERAIRFVTDPATGLPSKYDRDFRYPGYADWMSTRASRIDRDGRFAFPGYLMRRGERERRFVLRYDDAGTVVDTLHVPLYASARSGTAFIPTGPNGGRMVRGLDAVPFAPQPVWDVTPRGTLISGDGSSYLLAETDASGRVVRRFTRDVPLQRIAPGERRDSLRALERRIDSLPVPLANVVDVPDEVKDRRLPDVLPAYIDVVAATDGRIWVRRWPPPGRGNETLFDVFEADGRYLGTVVLPRRLELAQTPLITDRVIVGVIMDPDTETHTVVRLRHSIGGR